MLPSCVQEFPLTRTTYISNKGGKTAIIDQKH